MRKLQEEQDRYFPSHYFLLLLSSIVTDTDTLPFHGLPPLYRILQAEREAEERRLAEEERM